MKNILAIFTFYICGSVYCQNTPKINQTETLKVKQSFLVLIDALEHNNKVAVKNSSFSNIKCDYCDKSNIPINVLIEKELSSFKTSKIYTAYSTRGFSISEENFVTLGNLPIYTVWIQTLLPNEYAEGHEGASFGFQFSKENGEYKFYGLTSIP
jgi:hypothetical protein